MKKIISILLSLMIALPLTFQSVQPKKITAAEKSELTIYTGHPYSLYELTGLRAKDCKSVKPSSKILTYKKAGEGSVTGKKTGTVKLTVKPKKGSKQTYTVNVIKPWIRVTMFDVGQGDAFLIQTENRNILIDTGEYKMYSSLKSQLSACGVSKLDALIISHFDTDHFGSAQSVMKDYAKDGICIHPSRGSTSSTYTNFMRSMATNAYDELTLSKTDIGSVVDPICWEGMKFTLLSADAGEDTNDSSLVLRLDFNGSSWLFTGDASAGVLNNVMEQYPDLIVADVYKVSHHGSDYSNPVLFLSKMKASYAMIGVGKDNEYGHPTKNILARLEKYTKVILRTDLDGKVTLSYSGGKYEVTKSATHPENDKELEVKTSGKIIGNVNSKAYHNDSCTSLPIEKNRVYFDSSADAEAAGYHACGRCGG